MKFQLRVKSLICSRPRSRPIAVEITRSKLGHLVTAFKKPKQPRFFKMGHDSPG